MYEVKYMNTITLSKKQLQKFMVNYHMINTSHNLHEKQGVMDVFQKIYSIQFDPLNVVGKNADLVLQSRVRDYHLQLLQELLYEDRVLMDGWDKVMCIYQTMDFPYFSFVREHSGKQAIETLKNRLKGLMGSIIFTMYIFGI